MLLSGMFSRIWRSSGWDLAKGVCWGRCGRRGSRERPDAVRPIVGWRAENVAEFVFVSEGGSMLPEEEDALDLLALVMEEMALFLFL